MRRDPHATGRPGRVTMYERLVRPALFRLGGGDAETAHDWTLRRLAALSRHPRLLALVRSRFAVSAPTEVFGVRFANAVGLGAGMDKDGVALPAWPALGFGFVEVGTVTRYGQPGNSRPRLFRVPEAEALVNRMGFNNGGAAELARRLEAYRLAAYRPEVGRPAGESTVDAMDAAGPGAVGSAWLGVPLGISLGRSARTPPGQVVAEYLECLRLLRPYADYVAVNVSSPNTPGLRALQERDQLDELLTALVAHSAGVPVLVKLAPDLTDHAVAEAVGVCLDRGAAGVIATNTTVGLGAIGPADQARIAPADGGAVGGLSGGPLRERARHVVAFVHGQTGGRLPVIGVGGVLDPDDALALADAGASLVQLHTGLVYRGPGLVRASAAALASRRDGAAHADLGTTRAPRAIRSFRTRKEAPAWTRSGRG